MATRRKPAPSRLKGFETLGRPVSPRVSGPSRQWRGQWADAVAVGIEVHWRSRLSCTSHLYKRSLGYARSQRQRSPQPSARVSRPSRVGRGDLDNETWARRRSLELFRRGLCAPGLSVAALPRLLRCPIVMMRAAFPTQTPLLPLEIAVNLCLWMTFPRLALPATRTTATKSCAALLAACADLECQ
jgi:hypothetical protein